MLMSLFRGNNKEMFEDSLVNYLTENISKRRFFFNLSLRNYCYDDEEEDRHATHGSCAFMVPHVGKGYDMYYVNHHEAMDGTLDYERVLTRTRNKFLQATSRFHRAGPNRQVYINPIEGDHLL